MLEDGPVFRRVLGELGRAQEGDLGASGAGDVGDLGVLGRAQHARDATGGASRRDGVDDERLTTQQLQVFARDALRAAAGGHQRQHTR